MNDMTNLSFKKGTYGDQDLIDLTDVAGQIIFDNNTNRIYLGRNSQANGTSVPRMFGSNVENATWNSSTHTLSITLIGGTTLSLILDDSENGLMHGLRQSITENSSQITAIKGTGSGSFSKAISDAVSTLDGGASIASESNGIVTIKTGINEVDGVVSNSSGTDIVLHKLATSGSPSDLIVNYNGENVTLQAALATIKSSIDTASSSGTSFTVCQNSAASIPSGFQYYNGVTGTLAARNGSSTTVYLVKDGPDSFTQVVRTGTSTTNYAWTSLGSTAVDLTGFVKIIMINGKQYGAEGSTLVDLGEVITAISGQTQISNANFDFVHVVANTNNSNASTGEKQVSLEAQTKVVTVASGSNGLANASDIKDYVDQRIIFRTWTSTN